jgi:hypothetical protein
MGGAFWLKAVAHTPMRDLQNSAESVKSTEKHRSVEKHRRSSFIAFGGPRVKAGLSPGRQAEACPTWDKLQLVQARPGPQGHNHSLAVAPQ